MKTLFLILCAFALANIALGDNEPLQKSALIVRSHPKKYNSLLHRHLILNRRLFKKPPHARRLFTKSEFTDPSYTVFPTIPPDLKHANLPDSPYFPLHANIENKHRVKKVLPDYIGKPAPRRKRSPEDKSRATVKKDEKEVKDKKEVKTATTLAPTKKNDKPAVAKKEIKDKKEINSVAKSATTIAPAKKLALKTGLNSKTKKDSKKPKKNTGKTEAKDIKRRSAKRALAKGKGRRSVKDKKKQGETANDKKKTRRRRPRNQGQEKIKEGEGRRLIAARDDSIENYPYVVSIQKGGEHWCSGALINQRLVITTANCVWKSQGLSKLQVRAGSRYVDRDGQEAKIQEVMKHPGWSIRKNPDNDVALLLLDRVIRFSHAVHGVDLPNRVMLPIFDDVWVTSYGSDRRDGIYDRPGMTLQVYHARLIDRDKCNNITQRFGITVTPNFICLAQSGKRAPCTRDTGAPAVSDGVLWGLASWGIRKLCGTERFPAMFSFLASQSNMDFIAKATARLMSEDRMYPFHDRYVPAEHAA